MAATHVTMDSLVTTTGGLRLTQLPKVATVSCNDLTSTGGDLAFSDLGAAQLLHFPNLTTVAGTLKIANCGALAKLCGMSKVSESTKIQVTNSPALATGPVALLAKAGVTAALCITTTTTTTTSTVTRTTTTTNTTTPLLQDTFTPVVNTTTSTTTTTMFANCDSCCPAAAQSFTAVEFSFGMMGALILGSLFGVGTTICCLYASDRREREVRACAAKGCWNHAPALICEKKAVRAQEEGTTGSLRTRARACAWRCLTRPVALAWAGACRHADETKLRCRLPPLWPLTAVLCVAGRAVAADEPSPVDTTT